MATITDKIITDIAKVRSSGNSGKSRAKSENRQQAQVLTSFVKMIGNKSIAEFAKKMRSIEHSLNRAKPLNQRVTIKTSYSIESNTVKAKKLLKAHISYISRENTGDSQAFTANVLNLEKGHLKAFAEGTPQENEKTFRFIISPENAKDFENDEAFKKYIQECMERLSKDLPGKPRLNWVANIHYDTDNPHCHVLMKGLSLDGEDITIPKEYIKTKFRERAESLATVYLGTRTVEDVKKSKLAEIQAHRMTSIDYEILQNSVNGVFNQKSYDNAIMSQRNRMTTFLVPRLDYLCEIGLASKQKTKYTLHPNLKMILQEMPLNNDIIKKLAKLRKSYQIDASTKYDTMANNLPLVGTVIDKGFYHEEKQLAYLIILDQNNKSHFVKLNKNSEIDGNESSIGSSVVLETKSFTGRNGIAFKYPSLAVKSRLTLHDQIDHAGITDLDRLIALNAFRFDNPNVQQKQTTQAVEARIKKLMSEHGSDGKPKLYLIEGRYRFSRTYWLEAEKEEHSAVSRSLKNLTYSRLNEGETFTGRIIGTHPCGNENHAIVSNGKEYIIIPIRGRMNRYNDKLTVLEVTMQSDRKGYSAPMYVFKPIMSINQEQTIKR